MQLCKKLLTNTAWSSLWAQGAQVGELTGKFGVAEFNSMVLGNYSLYNPQIRYASSGHMGATYHVKSFKVVLPPSILYRYQDTGQKFPQISTERTACWAGIPVVTGACLWFMVLIQHRQCPFKTHNVNVSVDLQTRKVINKIGMSSADFLRHARMWRPFLCSRVLMLLLGKPSLQTVALQ